MIRLLERWLVYWKYLIQGSEMVPLSQKFIPTLWDWCCLWKTHLLLYRSPVINNSAPLIWTTTSDFNLDFSIVSLDRRMLTMTFAPLYGMEWKIRIWSAEPDSPCQRDLARLTVSSNAALARVRHLALQTLLPECCCAHWDTMGWCSAPGIISCYLEHCPVCSYKTLKYSCDGFLCPGISYSMPNGQIMQWSCSALNDEVQFSGCGIAHCLKFLADIPSTAMAVSP